MKKYGKLLLVIIFSACVTSCFSCSEKSSGYNVSFKGEAKKSCYYCSATQGGCTSCGGDGIISNGVNFVTVCAHCKGTGRCPHCGGDRILNN